MENCNESYIQGDHGFDSSTDVKINDSMNISYDRDKICQLIEQAMIGIEQIEIKSQSQDKELLDLMFSYHWYSTQVNSLKDLIPFRKPIRKRDDHNMSISSRMSVMSKINKESTRYSAHKVSISIRDDSRVKSLKKNLNPNAKTFAIKTIKVINKTNDESLNMSAKQSYKLKPRKKIDTNTSIKTEDSLDIKRDSYKLRPKKMLNSSQSGEIKTFVYSPIKDTDLDFNNDRKV
jgi:hypothetical protein